MNRDIIHDLIKRIISLETEVGTLLLVSIAIFLSEPILIAILAAVPILIL